MTDLPNLEDDKWELYNTKNDFSLTKNLAKKYPEKLEMMKELFIAEAQKYHVLPIDDRVIVRTNAELAGRPDLMGDRKSLTLYEGMEGMLENTFINIKNKSFIITAEVDVKDEVANGVLITQGGRFGGWCLYVKEGKPSFVYNYLGLESYTISSTTSLKPGKNKVVFTFNYDGDGLGKGGDGILEVLGGSKVNGRIEKTQPNIFSADETADVGLDNQTPVASGIGYGPYETKFTGKIDKVVVIIK